MNLIRFYGFNVGFFTSFQRFHEFYIREKHPEIKVIRKTLTEIHEQAKLGPYNELMMYVNKHLYSMHAFHHFSIYRNDIEVTVVYFRSGYAPSQYPTQNEWDARYLVEKSTAIKCPSIQYQLAGTKKVQQALAKKDILKRFLTDETKIRQITETFMGLYSMDEGTKEGTEALRAVLTHPHK